jgi:hypothetical protein
MKCYPSLGKSILWDEFLKTDSILPPQNAFQIQKTASLPGLEEFIMPAPFPLGGMSHHSCPNPVQVDVLHTVPDIGCR